MLINFVEFNALADPRQAFYGPLKGPWTPGWEPLPYNIKNQKGLSQGLNLS